MLRKIEDEDAGTEWERLEKEIREEFERLEKADRELGNDKSHQLVGQLRSQTDQVIRSKNVLMGRDVLGCLLARLARIWRFRGSFVPLSAEWQNSMI